MSKPRRKPREAEIVQHALAILRTEGDGGLTMRAVANAAQISLSNVQYYFRNKDALLEAIVEDYFEQCAAFLAQTTSEYGSGETRAALEAFLVRVLSDDHDMAEMCATFREFWAISTRDPRIATLVERYYQRTADLFADALLPEVTDPRKRAQVVMLVIPYIEGFTITGPLAGLTVEDAAELITNLVFDAIA